jgi:hypothetical protein
MTTDWITAPIVRPETREVQTSIAPPESSHTRSLFWPAVLTLAIVPTANIETAGTFFTLNGTCVAVQRRRENELAGYEVYSSLYSPSWEEIRVRKIQSVGHIKGNLKFGGQLKWLPYQP